jgi:serine/threonine protein kinase
MPHVSILPTLGRGENACEKIEFPDKTFIIKPLESTAEKTIAQKASDLNIGPKQFESLPSHLTEEFLEGSLLTRIDPDKCTPEFMKNIGIQLGNHLKTLHENNILINDQILSDDFSKSHLMVADDGSIKIIDFGASVDLSNFPNLTDEEIFSLIRTNPGGANSIRSKQDMERAIKEYREDDLSMIVDPQQLIQMKDDQLLHEGLGFLSQRLPNVEDLVRGLKETYFK